MEHDRAGYYSSYTVTVSRREGQVRMQLIDPVFLTGLLCTYIYIAIMPAGDETMNHSRRP